MNKRDALKAAKEAYAQLTPSRAGSYCFSKGVVIIAGYDQPVSIVIHTEKDLWRLRSVIDIAIHAIHKKKDQYALPDFSGPTRRPSPSRPSRKRPKRART